MKRNCYRVLYVQLTRNMLAISKFLVHIWYDIMSLMCVRVCGWQTVKLSIFSRTIRYCTTRHKVTISTIPRKSNNKRQERLSRMTIHFPYS